MIASRFSAVRLLLALIAFFSNPAHALSIREWRKYDRDKQAVYVGAAVSMAANMYAAQGEITIAKCAMDWYFRGKDGKEPTGPHDLALEIGIAERGDSDNYQLEGIVLGTVNKVCSNPKR